MVKCRDCGFLAVWHRQNRQWMEAEAYFRQRAHIEMSPDVHQPIYQPQCFANAADFEAEFAAICAENPKTTRPGTADNGYVLIFNRDRDCSQWVKWNQGFTPKEHSEMMHEKLLREWQASREDADRAWRDLHQQVDRTWREDQRKADQDWRELQEEKADAWRERQEKRADERNKSQIFWVAVIATSALVIAQLGAAIIQILPWLLSRPSGFTD